VRREVEREPNGDYSDGQEGWFQLWANGPLTPGVLFRYMIAPAADFNYQYPVPIEPVEIETAIAEAAPPYVPAVAAPEGVGAGGGPFEANLSVEEAQEWFESVRAGRPFRRPDK
jgi:hypothetical protein